LLIINGLSIKQHSLAPHSSLVLQTDSTKVLLKLRF
jgi:hypothetical protein